MSDTNTTTSTATTTTSTSTSTTSTASAISTILQGALASYATYYSAKQSDSSAGYVSSGARTVLISSVITALSSLLTSATTSSN